MTDLKIAQEHIDMVPSNERGGLSDGYHTFDELYEHRVQLFIALCRMKEFQKGMFKQLSEVTTWKSKTHSDGSVWDGWFLLGIGTKPGTQITYHLPISKWDECHFATELDKAPEFDWHTSADVLERLKICTNPRYTNT